MILIKDIPQVPLRTAIFKLIKEGQGCAVYGDVPEEAAFPYITLGAMNHAPDSASQGRYNENDEYVDDEYYFISLNIDPSVIDAS